MVKEKKISAETAYELINEMKEPGAGRTDTASNAAWKKREDVAIIGISCRFPDAEDVDEYWRNLSTGRNSCTRVPKERWSRKKYEDKGEISLPMQVGLLSGIDEFDPFFFHISPKEAELMDPQQRLFLQEAWKAIEDAGYCSKDIQDQRCAVFVGCSAGDYSNRIRAEADYQGSFAFTGNTNSILAARISYFLNLKGPSIAIDTACSSSLVAVHLACESIHAGTSEIAVAGGVTLFTTPEFYILATKAGMLSPTGRCRAFDEEADGFVPGEGVGAVVLKPLRAALIDNDHVYGVIKGSAINQDGKTSGIIAPSSPSQAALECEVYDKFGIDPETIGYIEAHGTGTKLGDPIEIDALTAAFRRYTTEKQFCAVGSVKTNIGHTIAAAGVASLIKVLLALKYGQIPPSLNFSSPNKSIDFKETPFYVNTALQEWQAPSDRPRRAAVSSFGFSGTNAHMVVEEFPHRKIEPSEPGLPYFPIVLSAKTEEALYRRMADLDEWLRKGLSDHRLEDIAYTLLAGRSHFKVRAAAVVKDTVELSQKIGEIREKGQIEDFFMNVIETNSLETEAEERERGKRLLDELREFKNLTAESIREKFLELFRIYVKGCDIDWTRLFKEGSYCRISLPTYPFARERYWLPEIEELSLRKGGAEGSDIPLHPLLDRNESDFEGYKFTLRLTGHEPYLEDSVAPGCRIIPAFVHIEMARAAGEVLEKRRVERIESLSWGKPAVVGSKPVDIRILLYPEGRQVRYSVCTVGERGQRITHSRGALLYEDGSEASDRSSRQAVDLEAVAKTARYRAGRDEFYRLLQTVGIKTREELQTVEELSIDERENEIFSRLCLPGRCLKGLNGYVLHPLLMSGSVETVLYALARKEQEIGEGSKPLLFSMGQVRIDSALPERCFVRVSGLEKQTGSSSEAWTCGIDILNDRGESCVQMKGVVLERAGYFTNEHEASLEVREEPVSDQGSRLLVLAKRWRRSTKVDRGRDDLQKVSGTVVFLVNEESRGAADLLARKMGSAKAVFLENRSEFEQRTESVFAFDFKDADQGMRAARRILKAKERIVACVDVSDLLSRPVSRCRVSMGKITLLQRLIENGRDASLHIVHVTRGLQTFGAQEPTLAGADLAGLVRLLGAEYRRVNAKTVDIDLPPTETEPVAEIVLEQLSIKNGEGEACYRKGKRYVPSMKVLVSEDMKETDTSSNSLPVESSKVYVISGGTGGVGSEIANHLVDRGARRIVLMGVTPMPPRNRWEALVSRPETPAAVTQRIERVMNIENRGALVDLYIGSLKDKKRLSSYFKDIRKRIGEVGGVIHCAGLALHEDPAFIKKRVADMQEVFEPKIEGAQNLHDIFAEGSLDFFVLFSSVMALVPDLAAGAIDYAMANAFMDYFASYQSQRGKKGYVSLNWPVWKDIGMGKPVTNIYAQLGFTSHTKEHGILLFETAMRYRNKAQLLPCIVHENLFPLDRLLKIGKKRLQESKNREEKPGGFGPKDSQLRWLRELFSTELKIPEEKLKNSTEFEEMGVDSIVIAELVRKIEKRIGRAIDPSIFLEQTSLDKLSSYLEQVCGQKQQTSLHACPEDAPGSLPCESRYLWSERFEQQHRMLQHETEAEEKEKAPGRARWSSFRKDRPEKIAVIGMACHFPGAQNTKAFWENLVAGRSGIKEIPSLRWDIDAYYRPDYEYGKSISKWGGFIDGIDYFDPEYFGISEEVADQIDPLMRQFLEVSVQTFRDAGYEEGSLANRKIGLFVGSRMGNYSRRIKKIVPHSVVGWGQNFIATHVSHFFNLKGPSLVIDSACSSSLVSIDLACRSLLARESEMAIAGGVDILLDEKLYVTLSAGRVLSPDGKCYAFDERANGFVPGEGCGAVLLKPLDRAIADNDTIYAVVESDAVNNDGRTMGMTTPNPDAQKNVIQEALEKKNIDPDTVTYIEAHGTGTMIGDPMELKALNQVFSAATEEKQFCAVGSVKTNIGHLLSAAGIASFIKVVLCLHNRKLVPTLNCERPNPRFAFDESPFFPIRETREWQPRNGMRRAGISSFGFGGTNCHIIVAEFDGQSKKERKKRSLPPALFHRSRYWIDRDGSDESPRFEGDTGLDERGTPDNQKTGRRKDTDQAEHLPELLRIEYE